MNQSEPTAALRTVTLFLVDGFGNGVAPSFSTGDVKLKKQGVAAANVGTLPTALAGAPVGTYTLVFAQAETNTLGPLTFWVEKTGVRTYVDAVYITANPVTATAAATLASVIENGYTLGGLMALVAATQLGSGTLPSTDGSYSIKGVDGTTVRVAGTRAAGVRTVTALKSFSTTM